ncbi:MAG TPA: HAD-IA family hydrolase [Thermoleophilaceae bacterium]|nr:HAD-IA family hydrolase [Thermoleophilaceae bacterium]
MNLGPLPPGALDRGDTRVLLCDADGCLFPSEEPAFVASAEVTNDLLASLGVERRFSPAELRTLAVGKSFRATAVELALSLGVALEPLLVTDRPGARVGRGGDGPLLTAQELERWVLLERQAVSARLGRELEPDPSVQEPLAELARRFGLAVVSSSALARLEVCFEATGLAGLFPPEVRFSAEDSLPVPTSKPDPAVYLLAGERLGVAGPQALAIEDSLAGARSALAAGVPTVGNVLFVPPAEREERAAALLSAGVAAVVSSWWELGELLAARPADAPLRV